MMTFKEFYLQSSKGNKAPPRPRRRFKTHNMPNKILDRIKKRKAAKCRSNVARAAGHAGRGGFARDTMTRFALWA